MLRKINKLQEYDLTKTSEVGIKVYLTTLCVEIHCSILLQDTQQIVLLLQSYCCLFH